MTPGMSARAARWSRGVWMAPYLDAHGQRVMVAVDSQGRKVAELSLTDPERRLSVADQLWGLLDTADPSVHLKVL